jgi:hypothetical protein
MPPKKKNNSVPLVDDTDTQNNEDVINFYETKAVRKHLEKTHNPNKDKHALDVNSRILLVGASGTYKTNTLMNMLNKFTGTFEHIHLITAMPDEPLYKHLQDKIDAKNLTIYSNIGALPSVDDINPDYKDGDQVLLIFDDMLSAQKDLKGSKILDYYIRGRKKNCTIVFISQSYYEIPKIIRNQLTYLIITKVSSDDDLKLIVRQYKLGVTLDELVDLYNKATEKPTNFFKIDLLKADKATKFSRNFINFFSIDKKDG